MEETKKTIRIRRTERSIKFASRIVLDYRYRDRDGVFRCWGTDLQPITEEQDRGILGKTTPTCKKITIPKNHLYVDVNVGLLEYGYILEHTSVRSKKYPNPADDLFELVDVMEETNDKMKDKKERIEVDQIVINMNNIEMYNLCCRLNIPVNEILNPTQLMESLIGDNGAAYANIKTVLEYKKNDAKEAMIMNINKGVILGLIEKTDSGYRYASDLRGTDVEQLVLWFTNNIDLYNNGLLPKIKEKEKELPLSIYLSENPKKAVEDLNANKDLFDVVTPQMTDWVDNKMKEVGIKNPQVYKKFDSKIKAIMDAGFDAAEMESQREKWRKENQK